MSPYFTQRLARLRQRLSASSFDALLLCDVSHCRYLTGFTNTDPNVAYVVVTADGLFMITDYRYSLQAAQECLGVEIIERDRANVSLGEQINMLLQQLDAKVVGFERDHFHYGLIEQIIGECPAMQFSGFGGWLEAQRMIKDDHEISCIKTAANIADQALSHLVGFMRSGMTEREVALELEYQIQKGGSEGLSFATIMLAGERSALPHGIPSDRQLKSGDLITIDFGAVVNGYRSDMTRAFCVGEPNDKQLAVYETVKLAQQVGIDAVRAGVMGSEPYHEVKKVLDSSVFSAYQGEGLGHGVGLVLHELPFMAANCEIELQPNMVITVEPGIYIPGWGGVRIEDDVIVTPTGCEVITHAPRGLIEI